MRDHEKAQEYFIAAQQVAGHDEPDKNDLWNMGIAPRPYVENNAHKSTTLGRWVNNEEQHVLEGGLGRGGQSANGVARQSTQIMR